MDLYFYVSPLTNLIFTFNGKSSENQRQGKNKTVVIQHGKQIKDPYS